MFERVWGQEEAKKYITKVLEEDNLRSAYIFEGERGIGKKTFALELSRKLVEEENLENSPDFFLILPQGQNIKIDQIRELQKEIIKKPYKNKKVFVIDESEKMNVNAQNALLKILEEPPSYAIFILLSQNRLKLLPTISSRCGIVRFSPLKVAEVEDFLRSEKKMDDEAKLYAAFSQGIVSRSLKLLESEIFQKTREGVEKFLDYVLDNNIVNILGLVPYMEKNKDQIDEILDIAISYFRDMLFCKEKMCEKIVNLDKKELIEEYSSKFAYFHILSIIDIIEETRKALRSNCNFNLAIEVMLLNIQEVKT